MSIQAPTAEDLKPVGTFTYFDHQVVAIRWMLNLEKNGYKMLRPVRGGILADDMGLGKTLEIIGLIHNSPAKHTLLLCPLALIDNWVNMACKADFNVFTFSRAAGWSLVHRSAAVASADQKAVFVSNYDKLLQENYTPYFCGAEWDRVVIDEAHKIRNPGTALYKKCMKLKASTGRWAVTGTPVVNSLNDVAALLRWCGVTAAPKWSDTLHSGIAPHLVLHRSLHEMRGIIPDAPPEAVIERVVLPFKTEEEAEFYKCIQGVIKRQLAEAAHDVHSSAMMLTLLLRLRQISVHPQVYINGKRRSNPHYSRPDWTLPVTKFEAIRERITADAATGPHKYIFICHFEDEIHMLREFLTENKLVDTVTEYYGALNQSQRRESIKEVETAPGSAAILLQLQAGGVGLNLQCCDRVVFLSPWWTSALMDQAIARAVRMGQREVVRVWHVCLEEEETLNIDRFITTRAEYKQELAAWFFSIVHRQAALSLPIPPPAAKLPEPTATPTATPTS